MHQQFECKSKFMLKKYSFYISMLFLFFCSISSAMSDNSSLQGIPVELTTHLGYQQQFVEGDEIQFLLSLGSDAFIYMFYVNADNVLVQILPSKKQDSNFYSKGFFLTIPEYEDGYRFIIKKPFGKESVWIFASDQFISLDKNDGSISSIRQKIKQQSSKEFGETVFEITTRKK